MFLDIKIYNNYQAAMMHFFSYLLQIQLKHI